MEISEYVIFVRSFGYMTGVDRDKNRKDSTQEYFTSTEFVNEVLIKLKILNLNYFTIVQKHL